LLNIGSVRPFSRQQRQAEVRMEVSLEEKHASADELLETVLSVRTAPRLHVGDRIGASDRSQLDSSRDCGSPRDTVDNA
jgi:hypothetical protein